MYGPSVREKSAADGTSNDISRKNRRRLMIPIGFSKEGWDEIDCGERCSTRSTVGTQQEGSSSPYLMSRYTPDELHQDLFVARDASLAPLLVLGQHDDG